MANPYSKNETETDTPIKNNANEIMESINKFQLFLNCQRCGTTNREISKYCKNCGQPKSITEFSQEKLSKILAEFYSERELTKEEIQKIRDRINLWVNKIPNFIQNFGDIIEIKSAKEIPDYRIKVSFLSESRKIQRQKEPYRGEKYPITPLTEENIWNNEVIQTERVFSKNTRDYPLSRTQEILNCEICRTSGYVRCYNCDGKGVLTCYSCDGKGVLTCFSCNGKGRVKCDRCYGKGRIECSSCWGRGRIERSSYENGRTVTFYEPCSSCGGTGYITCSTCDGSGTLSCSFCYGRGVNTCSTCDGRGLLTCKTCDGSGKITCSNCDGKGRLLSYSLVRQEYLLEEKETKLESDYPQSMLTGKDEYTVGEKFNDAFNKFSQLYLEVSTDLSNPEKLFSGENLVVKEILNLLGQSPKLEQNTKPVAVRVQVRKLPVFKITYEYSGKSYELWIFGKDITNSSIYSEKDPLKELENLILNNFNEYFKNKNIEKMWELYYQLEDMIFSQPEAESRKKLLEETLRKLADTEIELNLKINTKMLGEFCSQFNKLIQEISLKIKKEFTLKKMFSYIFSEVYYPLLKSTVDSGSTGKSVLLYRNLLDNRKIFKEEIFEKILEESNFFTMFNEQIKKKIEEKNFSFAFKLTEVVKKGTGRLPSKELVEKMKEEVKDRYNLDNSGWAGQFILIGIITFFASAFSNDDDIYFVKTFLLINPIVVGFMYIPFWKHDLFGWSFILVPLIVFLRIIPSYFSFITSLLISIILYITMGILVSQYKKKLLNLLKEE